MKKSEIVKFFLERKVFLSPEVLDFLYQNQDEIKKALQIVDQGVKVLTLEALKQKQDTRDVEIIIEEYNKINEVTIDKIKECLRKRFDFLSSILRRKPELKNTISINKIKNNKEFSLIGIVKEKEEGRIIIEDKTGHVGIFIPKKYYESVYIDEVVGVRCYQEEKNIFAKSIIKPDIPVFRKNPKTERSIILTSDRVILSGEEKPIKWSKIARIELDGFFVVFLDKMVVKKYGEINTNTVLKLLKGRNLNPTIIYRDCFYEKDPYLLDKIPDLIIVPYQNLETRNYKGTTIVLLPEGYGIDLSRRKAIKL